MNKGIGQATGQSDSSSHSDGYVNATVSSATGAVEFITRGPRYNSPNNNFTVVGFGRESFNVIIDPLY